MEGNDSEQIDAEEHIRIATEMYERWRSGDPKSRLEDEYFGNTTANGKVFNAYVKRWIGKDTERRSRQSIRIEELETILRANGILPEEDGDLAEEFRLLANARESALAAIRTYNDPLAGYRTEAFVVLMIGAWNSLLQAVLERSGIDYYEYDEDGNRVQTGERGKVLGTRELVELALEGEEQRPLRANLDFFIGLRNEIAHRYLPALDVEIVGEAQAMLLNFEDVLTAEFGREAALGNRLAVPLQLSGFRNDGSLSALRKAQGQLASDVEQYLARHRAEQDADILGSPKYCRRIFFIHATANRERSADAVVHFISPDEITPELEAELAQIGVVTKPRITPVASGDLFRPTEVVSQVAAQLPFRFTMHTHTQCWKHFEARPPGRSANPEATDARYCRWDRLSNGYGYTKAWINKLIRHLSDPGEYEEVVGFPPAHQ